MITRRCFSGATAAALLHPVLFAAVERSSVDGEVATVARRLRERLCATPLDTVELRAHFAGLDAQGFWPDIDYADPGLSEWAPSTHLLRLRDLAEAYACAPDAAMAPAVRRAFCAWIGRDPQSVTWWHTQIRTPELLGEVTLLASPLLTDEERAAAVKIMERAYRPRSVGQENGNSGANRLWRAGVLIHRGVLGGDASLVAEGFAAIGDSVFVVDRLGIEGVQRDGSFHQHGAQLQNLSYGEFFAGSTLRWAAVAAGTRFAMPAPKTRALTDFLLDGTQWMVRGPGLELSAMGRNVARQGLPDAAEALLPKARLAMTLGPYRRAELRALVTRLEAARAQGAADERLALTGHRHFWRSDLTTHHRPGWYVSVKTSSPLTLQPETGNDENLQGLHLADGMTLIMRRGDEYDRLRPALDWRKLPGVTAEQANYPLKPSKDWGVRGTSRFTGGVSDGRVGATAYQHDRLGVHARKAWFFFDDAVVALGANVAAPNGTASVVTCVNQALLRGPVLYRAGRDAAPGRVDPGRRVEASDLAWVHHDGTAYFFLSPSGRLAIEAGPRTGSWTSINARYHDPPLTLDAFALEIDHGVRPTGVRYAYSVAPGLAADAVEAFRASRLPRLIRNDAVAQAVADDRAQIWQAVFHDAGEIRFDETLAVAVDRPAIVMLRRRDGRLRLSAACPDPEASTLRVTVSAETVTLLLPQGVAGGSSVHQLL